MTYRASAVVRCPDGGSIGLGGWASGSPGRALGWVRKRAEQVAEQLGAPYDGAVREWLADGDEYQWALYGLAGDVPFTLEAVDGDGCTYVLAVWAEWSDLASRGREAAWLAA
ncbi:hypothetical protein AB0D04_09730 [Streptomyces sp. NPDC048483]|uniref:hypothetical protein n=1 Tax=Streptomyces sp. NPDC048483 TaxID=3154927 RepID=UPI00341A69EB